MKNGKTPGSDGYPAEFYKFFWTDIGSYVLNSLNEAFQKGELSVTQRLGILTCLPKDNKPQEFLKNLRPITLLNVDYKLLSGVLAMRIQKVLPDVISAPQKGFLKGRYIGENTRLVCDIINYLKGIKKEGLILLIDFQKAFDSLEWKYINEVLLSYNFGKCYRKWFKILYNKSCSSVINNGYLSESFPLERGCRQGDPLSPYIFILAIEPFAMMIKNNKQIEGIEVQNHTFKIGLYADDIFVLLKNSESSVRESIHVFRNFEICSGLKMNLEKTHVARIGHLGVRNRALCNDLNLIWVKDFKLLGIVFDNDVDKMLEKNFSNRLQGIEKLFNLYQNQHLSII